MQEHSKQMNEVRQKAQKTLECENRKWRVCEIKCKQLPTILPENLHMIYKGHIELLPIFPIFILIL